MSTRCLISALALLSLPIIAAPASAEAASLSACVDGLRTAAIRAGVSRAVANKALTRVKFDEKAVRFSRSQPEYKTPIWDYMAFLVDKQRISDGRAAMKRYASTLRRAEKAYGIDRYILTALWGIESDYGKAAGDFFIPHALANIVCAGRKPRYFRGELIAALKLVSRGDLKLADLKGSWAGAFGQTQFMPTTYQRLAVDFDRNGRRDLVHSVPDALASAANFLKKAGWRRGQPWGYEVRLPKGYNGPAGRRRRATLTDWARRGLRRVDGGALRGRTPAALILPAGRHGPAFLVGRNFNALRSYNASTAYALSISHLSDRLRGRPGLKGRWPTAHAGLSRAERLELQKRLIRNGFDIGEADGRIGPITIRAIRAAERKFGMKVTGRPGRAIYRALERK